MYFLIETEEQLDRFSAENLDEVFLHVIPMNDRVHPAMQNISLLYLRPLHSDEGYLIALNHTETFTISQDRVLLFITERLRCIYVLDLKTTLHYGIPSQNVYCINTAKNLAGKPIIREDSYDTLSHKFFYGKYADLSNINMIIPAASHLKKCDAIFENLAIDKTEFEGRLYKFYNSIANPLFFQIEQVGIGLDVNVFREKLEPKTELYSVNGHTIYSQYNLFTSTGRPSNSFNNINFAALNKSDATRNAFVPKKDIFVEFDYRAYHIRLLAQIVEYDFGNEDIHEHLGRRYFNTTELTPEQYADSKNTTFRLMFGENRMGEYRELELFKRVSELKERLWQQYQQDGFIESVVSGRLIRGIETRNQLLPYLLQLYETERNILVLREVLTYLRDKRTKLVLYSYDAFLFDCAKSDGVNLLHELQRILEEGGFTTSVTYGKNYGEKVPLV